MESASALAHGTGKPPLQPAKAVRTQVHTFTAQYRASKGQSSACGGSLPESCGDAAARLSSAHTAVKLPSSSSTLKGKSAPKGPLFLGILIRARCVCCSSKTAEPQIKSLAQNVFWRRRCPPTSALTTLQSAAQAIIYPLNYNTIH